MYNTIPFIYTGICIGFAIEIYSRVCGPNSLGTSTLCARTIPFSVPTSLCALPFFPNSYSQAIARYVPAYTHPYNTRSRARIHSLVCPECPILIPPCLRPPARSFPANPIMSFRAMPNAHSRIHSCVHAVFFLSIVRASGLVAIAAVRRLNPIVKFYFLSIPLSGFYARHASRCRCLQYHVT